MKNRAAVVTVIVVLAAVSLIGICGAIVLPNLIPSMQRSHQKRTMADIRTFGNAVDAYAADNRVCPPSLEVLVPKYLRAIPRNDMRGFPYQYACWGGKSYVIAGVGKDGRLERSLPAAASQPQHATTNFDCDIVYSNGSFVEYPEGIVEPPPTR